jgi:hypothetical protein
MEIFVSDVYEGIFLVDKNQSIKHITVDKQLFSDCCVCEINKSQLCVGLYKSNNVLLMSTDGKDKVELLTGQDGFTNPVGLCFDNKTSRLFVSCRESDILNVFTLKKSH